MKTLTDAENLLAAERNHCKVVKNSIDRLSASDRWFCRDILADQRILAVDYEIVDNVKKELIAERAAKLRDLAKIQRTVRLNATPRPKSPYLPPKYPFFGFCHSTPPTTDLPLLS